MDSKQNPPRLFDEQQLKLLTDLVFAKIESLLSTIPGLQKQITLPLDSLAKTDPTAYTLQLTAILEQIDNLKAEANLEENKKQRE